MIRLLRRKHHETVADGFDVATVHLTRDDVAHLQAGLTAINGRHGLLDFDTHGHVPIVDGVVRRPGDAT